MKRRLLVAKALVHKPPIIILDEPTAGVDVELRSNLWKSVKQLNKQGVTIILSTHYLSEAEEMCDRIGILNKGNLVALDTTKNLLKRIQTKVVKFLVDKKVDINNNSLKSISILSNEENEHVDENDDKVKEVENKIRETLLEKQRIQMEKELQEVNHFGPTNRDRM